MIGWIETNPTGDEEIYVASRSALGLEFAGALPVTTLNDPATNSVDGAPFISEDGREMFFRSFRSGSIDLFRAVREGDGFGVPEPVAELNTSDNDSFPALSADGLTIVYSSTRTDGGAQGGYDIWIAKRPSVDQAFEAPRNEVELNTTDGEYANFISPDGCTVYFHRLVDGINRVYFAERPR